jgi:hypothetical protein
MNYYNRCHARNNSGQQCYNPQSKGLYCGGHYYDQAHGDAFDESFGFTEDYAPDYEAKPAAESVRFTKTKVQPMIDTALLGQCLIAAVQIKTNGNDFTKMADAVNKAFTMYEMLQNGIRVKSQ